MADVKLKELIINECSSVPSTFEPNQLYLTPDTTEEDISNAVKESKEYTDKVVDEAVKSIDLSEYATKTELNTKLSIDTKYGSSLSLTIDNQSYILTAQLKDQNGGNLGTAQTVDLPLETMVVGAEYDEDTKEVVLTLKNGQTVRFSIADLVSGLQPAIPDLSSIRSGAEKGSTAVQPEQLSAVATSGSYNDLSNKPTIPTKTSELTNNSEFTTTTYVKDEINEIRTNCITEIPQDIKLELNNGVLTLKAGSKVYVPNGFESDGTTPKFDVVVIESDIRVSNFSGNITVYQFYSADKNIVYSRTNAQVFSGSTAPTSTTYMFWYDTTNNVIKVTSDTGATWRTEGWSLPISIAVTTSNNVYTSIDQVFNGFGYIGSTVFALPGVKGLIPNGRNEDGTLKNTAFSVDSLLTRTLTGSFDAVLGLKNDYIGQLNVRDYSSDYKNNYIMNGNMVWNFAIVGTFTQTNGVISNFQPKTTFHAVDYNDAVLNYGDQDIGGNKNFTGTLTQGGKNVITSAGGVVAGSITLKDTQTALSPSEDTWHMASVPFFDKSGVRVSYIQPKLKSNGTVELNIAASDPTNGAKALVLSSGGTLTWNGKNVLTPAGSILPYGGSSAPSGYLLCNGAAVSRTTYADLFKAIGTTYGTGNGSTTFNLPNLSSARMVTSSTVSVKGNGYSLGLTSTGSDYKTIAHISGYAFAPDNRDYSKLPVSSSGIVPYNNAVYGITTDATKSGITGKSSLATSTRFIIKY